MTTKVLTLGGSIGVHIFISQVLGLTPSGCYDLRKIPTNSRIAMTEQKTTSKRCFDSCGSIIAPYAGTKKTVKDNCWCLVTEPPPLAKDNDANCNIVQGQICNPETELCGGTSDNYIVTYKVGNIPTVASSTKTTQSMRTMREKPTTTTPTTQSTTKTMTQPTTSTSETPTSMTQYPHTFNCQYGVFNKFSNTRATSNVIQSIVTDRPVYCAVKCSQKYGCTRFSLNFRTKQCLLHTGKYLQNIEFNNDWSFFMTCQ